MEIYNESIVDLLSLVSGKDKNDASGSAVASSGSRGSRFISAHRKDKRSNDNNKTSGATKLEVTTRSTDAGARVVVRGLTSKAVSSPAEANELFNQGMKCRAVAATDVHAHSSRSHCIVRVDVRGEPRDAASSSFSSSKKGGLGMGGAKEEEKKYSSEQKSAAKETTLGRLYLVDLAGSERINKSGVEGKRLTEAKNINRSLSALGDVIEALDKKRGHVPYRNSTLTRVLQDALCARSVVAVVVTICPTENTADESLCSLYFAQRLRSVEMGVAQRKITVRNNAAEAETLRSKLSNLVTWRKKAIVELEELRGKAQKTVEEHGKKEVKVERAMKNLRADLEASVEAERRRVRMLESKWNSEHDRLAACEARAEASDKSVERQKVANEGEENIFGGGGCDVFDFRGFLSFFFFFLFFLPKICRCLHDTPLPPVCFPFPFLFPNTTCSAQTRQGGGLAA